jgi:hypothetical protein
MLELPDREMQAVRILMLAAIGHDILKNNRHSKCD